MYICQGLTNYLEDLKFAAAQQDDLWKHLTDQAHRYGIGEQDDLWKHLTDQAHRYSKQATATFKGIVSQDFEVSTFRGFLYPVQMQYRIGQYLYSKQCTVLHSVIFYSVLYFTVY